RSPFRPNPLGLSAVKLEDIVLQSPEGPLLRVSGADLLHGTPIFDIKPYLPYADCIPQATGGFAGTKPEPRLEVNADPEILQGLPAGKWATLHEVLSLDPRPSYQNDPERVYGFAFAGRNVRFRVSGSALEVLSIDAIGEKLP
ncbi:TrmO family methyltransferase, partial [uncultured Bilophila sp.]|uniref:TrmO family methyltransferase domain-containing protein n=1 Tax=uncultured Bilophila sp. TaxID=529385 RepID=UPI00280B4F64